MLFDSISRLLSSSKAQIATPPVSASTLDLSLQGAVMSNATVAAAPEGELHIFIVHGHDEALKHHVARTIEHMTGVRPTILDEAPNSGRTILEKFEYCAAQSDFAVVLLTADDRGGKATSDTQMPRARQNVLIELGFFIGKVGRERVTVLCAEGIEIPSDINGMGYTAVDSAGGWRVQLANDLRRAGISADLNELLPS